MNLHVIHTGNFKLDGGAMFGVVPRVIWENLVPPDEKNLCTWSMRCLLVEDGKRLILIDTGIGNKQGEKFFRHYYRSETVELVSAIEAKGFSRNDITDVFLTHLHFDHVGGAVEYNSEGNLVPVFPNAKYWTNKEHWNWATNPNAREKASFLSENMLPLLNAGQLNYIETGSRSDDLPFSIHFMDGHTEKQMLPEITYKGRQIVFVADLLPSYAHIPLPYVMGYDVRPLLTLKEKEKFLLEAYEKGKVLFFEHDSQHECATLKMTEKGVAIDQLFPLNTL